MPEPTTAGMATLLPSAMAAMTMAMVNERLWARTTGSMRRIQPSDVSGSMRPAAGA